jgi:predicted dehydrogenase
MGKTKIGIIGCGMISDAYFKAAQTFNILEVAACADVIADRSAQKQEAWGAESMSYEALLGRKDLEVIINLTPPLAHSKVTTDILNAGKHAYSEKPFGVDADDAAKVIALAKAKNLRVGSAPDTFMGAGQQTARKLIDDGWIGKPLAGTAIVMGRGPEKWGQAPFFYDYGAGPMLDLGPYYITSLVNMLGAAESVTAVTRRFDDFRTLGAEVSEAYKDQYKPYDKYPVTVTTHLTGVIEFKCGAIITVISSFDVYKHGHSPIEIYGSQGSLQVPDPNTFGGPVKVFRPEVGEWETVAMPFRYSENSRSIGVADMAYALRSGRKHRANGELANHVLEIMLAFDKSSKAGGKVMLETTCERPEALPLGLDEGMLPE